MSKKRSNFSGFFSKFTIVALLIGVNLGFILILKWNSILSKFHVEEDRALSVLEAFISIQALLFSLFFLLLFQYRSAIMKRFMQIRLSYRILLGFLFGCIVGVIVRKKPEFFGVIGIEANSFKILGKIFVDLIKMAVTPLVFASITCSIISIKDGKKTGKIAMMSIITFLIMTFVSVSIGMVATLLVKPGNMVKTSPEKILLSSGSDVDRIVSSGTKLNSFSDFLLDIIPDNVFKSFYSANLLQIIFFSVIFGIAIRSSGQQEKLIGKAMNSLNDIMFKVTDIIMQFAPFGVFGFVVWLIGTQDISLIKSLGVVIWIVYLSTLFMVYVLYSAFMMFVLKLNPLKFFKKFGHCQFAGFLLASSSAMLPLSLKTSQEKLGVSKEKALFVIPLGATVNMNGTALNLAVYVLFISQIFGVQFDFSQMIYILLLCTLGAVGTAPVPGSSIFLLFGILSVLNLPPESIGIILAVDRILDMMRTFGNMTGDVLSAVIVDRLDGTLDEKVWNQ